MRYIIIALAAITIGIGNNNPTPGFSVEEDTPFFDCTTMGNYQCGPGYPVQLTEAQRACAEAYAAYVGIEAQCLADYAEMTK